MSRLIDKFTNTSTQGLDGKWYIAKPEPAYGFYGLKIRLQEAWEVLLGEAVAVHFQEDINNPISLPQEPFTSLTKE